jgi:5,5'-dehydrodivanillate O-demethylase
MGQDLMAWETQGKIFDRTRELIGAGDKGVVMYRKLLKEQILAVQRGEEPTGLVRDPKLNEMIRFSQVTSGFMRASREREEAHH